MISVAVHSIVDPRLMDTMPYLSARLYLSFFDVHSKVSLFSPDAKAKGGKTKKNGNKDGNNTKIAASSCFETS